MLCMFITSDCSLQGGCWDFPDTSVLSALPIIQSAFYLLGKVLFSLSVVGSCLTVLDCQHYLCYCNKINIWFHDCYADVTIECCNLLRVCLEFVIIAPY